MILLDTAKFPLISPKMYCIFKTKQLSSYINRKNINEMVCKESETNYVRFYSKPLFLKPNHILKHLYAVLDL